MNLEELLETVQGTLIGKKKPMNITDFSIDTRTLKKGDVYIAIQGEQFDGHQFLKEAEEKGAKLAIVSQKPNEKLKRLPLIYVENTLQAMTALAIFMRKKYTIPLIAVTGSVGKSTLKELIAAVLSPDYRVLKSIGNHNNHIGLPLTLLKLNTNYDVIVTELGMNHLGEINKLSKICTPNISLITNIGTSHIGYLGSKKNIFKAKMEICNGMSSGLLIVNGKDRYLKKVKSNEAITCLKCDGRNAEIKIGDVEVTLDETIFSLIYQKKKHVIKFPYAGKHYPNLIAMAILVGLQMNIEIDTCMERIKKVVLLDNRLAKIELGNEITMIDDSYNASLESFDSAIDLVKKDARPKLLIIGDILELGRHGRKIHLKLIKKLNRMKNCEVWLIGSELKELQKQIHMGTYFETIEDMKKAVLENEWKQCMILVKGSNGIHLSEVSQTIKEKYENEERT